MIRLTDVSLRRGERLLLSAVSQTLYPGWRVGVVGRNGCGKSSLFAAILGELEADRGNIELSGGARMASVAQETPALPDPAIEFVIAGDRVVAETLAAERDAQAREDWEAVAEAHQKLDAIGGYDAEARAGRLLHGLGFAAADINRPVADFSGGWRSRLNLGRALMAPSDILLLDEPTNHLDLDAIVWLEEWLISYPGLMLVISHDREFLDHVCTHTLHLGQGTATLYPGGYSEFERLRAEQLHQQGAQAAREAAERERLTRFIERFRAQATKAKQAQSRVKRLQKLAGTEAVRAERSIDIVLPEPARQPHDLLRLREVSAGYAAGSPVLRNVDIRLEAGDRIGLLGVNGAGKSTLVKTLVGSLAPLGGQREAHGDLVIGYFAQHAVEQLEDGATPMDHLRRLSPDSTTQVLRDYLGRWQFPSDQAFADVAKMSGGERARLSLALCAWLQPNLLVLDEPTNHLDLDMREALAEGLADFTGAIALVSHDRHLLGLVADRFWHIGDGRVRDFDGDLDDYGAWRRAEERASGDAPDPAAAKRDEPKASPSKAPVEGDASNARNARTKPLVPAKLQRQTERSLSRLEKRLEEVSSDLAAIEARFADADVLANPDLLIDLGRQRSTLESERDEIESEWLQLSESATAVG